MNVTDVPAQIVVAEAAICTESVTDEVTVIVIPVDVAGLPVTPDRLEVMTQVTIWPLVRVDEVKVTPVPAFTPLTFHW